MEIASQKGPSKQVVYLPHHAVFRETSSTAKLRVVYNAKYPPSNWTLLNHHLMAGLKLQTGIVDVVLRWRQHPVVLVADVEKMF